MGMVEPDDLPVAGGSAPDGAVAAQSSSPVLIYSCNRLGLQANPPGFQFKLRGWFRRR
ncbi:hypothetical protein [Mycolicibacterium palauense]|uniref:hypothetical protein n=1 Tax=Mycolicibacterium palauense TaxID=2034511 RepID=UPI00159BC1F4|nr:hypothetical protein [Mycolicibacterium palauense]